MRGMRMRTDASIPGRMRRLGGEIAQIIFGPWPIRPVLLGFISFVVFQYASGVLAVAENQVFIGARSGLPVNVARAAAVGLAFALLLWLYRRITGRIELTRTGYLIILIVVGISAGITRYATVLDAADRDAGQLVFGAIRGVVTLMILTSALGIADSRLLQQIRQTDAALEIVRTQRRAVLESEERAKQSIAALLHDRVQAGLVAAMLQLRPLEKSLNDEEAARLQSVIADLEAMRTQDVREASRRLSPDLRNMSLEQAIKVLALTYEPAMTVSVHVADPKDFSTDEARRDIAQLGVYRIVEQALLNAAVHGQATRVDVTCRLDGEDLVLTVTDNGQGLGSAPISPGAGSAVIDAWTGALEGEWSLNEGSGGTALTVRLSTVA